MSRIMINHLCVIERILESSSGLEEIYNEIFRAAKKAGFSPGPIHRGKILGKYLKKISNVLRIPNYTTMSAEFKRYPVKGDSGLRSLYDAAVGALMPIARQHGFSIEDYSADEETESGGRITIGRTKMVLNQEDGQVYVDIEEVKGGYGYGDVSGDGYQHSSRPFVLIDLFLGGSPL